MYCWLLCGVIVLLFGTICPTTIFAQGVLTDTVATVVRNTEEEVDIYLPDIEVYAKPSYSPLSYAEKEEYWRRIRDVKKVLPFARKLTAMMIETYEYIETLPNESEKDRHLERVEREMIARYKPVMKTWTLSQGTLLIKLMNRQTGVPSYDIVSSILGSFAAGWYNLVARFYGGNLKDKYDPENNSDDAVTERIIYLYDHNLL
jgi:hypothetical protein